MAVAFLRSVTATANGAPSATLILTGVTAGNKLVLAGAAWQDTGTSSLPSGVSSAPAATWRNDANGPIGFTGPGQGNQTFLWSADIGTSGTVTVTVTWPRLVYAQLCLAEYSGLVPGGAALDAVAGNEGQSLAASPSTVGPTATLGQAEELVLGVYGASSATAGSALGIAEPAGWTNRFRVQDGYTICATSIDEVVTSTTAARSASWAHDTDEIGAWSGLIGTYRVASGAAVATASHAATLARPSQGATVVAPGKAAAAKTLARPTQVGTAVVGPVVQSITWDSDATAFDQGNVTFDGDAVPSGAVAGATQSLAALSQTARGRPIAAAAQAASLPLPGQTATARGAFGVVTAQQLPAVAQDAAVVTRVTATHNRPLTTPGQTATAIRVASASAAKLLLPVAQVTSTRPIRAAQQSVTLTMPDQRATAVKVAPARPPVELISDSAPVEPGTLDDMIARQIAVLPPWFGAPGVVPAVLRVPLAMAGQLGQWINDLIEYARRQTRILTATDGWLDLIAWDFLGERIRRRQGQPDDSFRHRILVEMFRPRATRPAMAAVLRDLTGQEPRIFEPQRPQDVGGIGVVSAGLAIGVSGAIGSVQMPGEVFIDVFRDPDAGIPGAAGIGVPVGGIGTPSRLVIASLEDVVGALRDEDIYSAVEATRPVGIVAWVRISLGRRTAA